MGKGLADHHGMTEHSGLYQVVGPKWVAKLSITSKDV